MSKIAGSYDELYHYTTAAGLSGILESKSLWATHSSFMNDEEEISRFYDRVLSGIIRPVYLKYVEDNKLELQKKLGSTQFDRSCEELFAKIIRGARCAASSSHDQYITSFSTTNNTQVRENGLLSQWRAYGPDGGYALVFDKSRLDNILSLEKVLYQGEICVWAKVQYLPIENQRTNDSATNKRIEELEVATDKFFRSDSDDDAGIFSDSLTILSSTFKHPGFSEEREVRLVLSLLGPKLESHPELSSVRQHQVKTRVREGTTVPYVELFVRVENDVKQHLPIKRIIVGPHRDKNDRKRAVKLLLKQYGLTADVCISDIPYRGI